MSDRTWNALVNAIEVLFGAVFLAALLALVFLGIYAIGLVMQP
jgi:hypothetical protein